jgi:hypothetical protein
MNITIKFEKQKFATQDGIFSKVADGKLTDIIFQFTEYPLMSKTDLLQLVVQEDEAGRTPIDIAAFLDFKNILLYLMTKIGTPREFIESEMNVDGQGRHLYHTMMYRGNFEALVIALNYERVCLKKVIFDELVREKQMYKFKNLDIKQGALVSTVYHDADTVRRHADFNMKAGNLFEKYA